MREVPGQGRDWTGYIGQNWMKSEFITNVEQPLAHRVCRMVYRHPLVKQDMNGVGTYSRNYNDITVFAQCANFILLPRYDND